MLSKNKNGPFSGVAGTPLLDFRLWLSWRGSSSMHKNTAILGKKENIDRIGKANSDV